MNRKKIVKRGVIGFLIAYLIFTLFFVVIPKALATTGCFDDTNGHIFETYICWMDDHGITSGCGGGNFCPNDSVTLGQMSVFIKRVFDLAEANDDDTLASLSCATDEIAKWNGSVWECQEDVDTDTDTDTLASLSCATDEIAKWNGSAWVCEPLSNYYTKSEVDALMADMDSRVAALETKLASASVSGDNLYFTGVNVHVRDGSGDTDGTVNGLGNLIVGYNEDEGGDATRTGSHNLVVGPEHTYLSYGGFVAGYQNAITGNYASVSGGKGNEASGPMSSVSGGNSNTASANYTSVSGGRHNTASDWYASVSGGRENEASGGASSISGGYANEAIGNYDAVSGGYGNMANGYVSSISGGEDNIARGQYASVSGGYDNKAWAHYSVVVGGRYNVAGDTSVLDHTAGEYAVALAGQYSMAYGDFSSVSGGDTNKASGSYSSVSGGYLNTASGNFACVNGGTYNHASGAYSTIGGGLDDTLSGMYDWRAGDLIELE